MKTIFTVCALLVLSPDASACWSCAGLTPAECTSMIQKPQRKLVEEMVAKNQEFCGGKEEGLYSNYIGRQLGAWSTDPSATVYCSGENDAGWVIASFDSADATNKLEYFPLGENRDGCRDETKCSLQQASARTLLSKGLPRTRLVVAAASSSHATASEQNAPSGGTSRQIATSSIGDPPAGLSGAILFQFAP